MANQKRLNRHFSIPDEAMRYGPREDLLYVACSPADPSGSARRPDSLVTVDVKPDSPTYCKVIHQLCLPHVGDEVSHLGWNTCMSCYGEDADASHEMLVATCLKSSRIYIIDVGTHPREPSLRQVIEDDVIRQKTGLTSPTTSHCLGFGQVMVSARDEGDDPNKGGFIVLEGRNLDVKERWDCGDDSSVFCQDFWYQLMSHNVIVSSTGWGRPDILRRDTTLSEAFVSASKSRSLHFWDFSTKSVVQCVDLGEEGAAPLAVRFLHDPEKCVGFVSSACGSGIFRFHKTKEETWHATKVISIPPKKVDGWIMDSMPAMTTDLVLSLDDKFLYCSNWLQGDIRQYDVTDTEHPKLVGQVFVGGLLRSHGDVVNDVNSSDSQNEADVKAGNIHGGPSKLNLSLDGTRLYVTTSLVSHWDAEIYPDMAKNGCTLLRIDVDNKDGGLTVNGDFSVDFANEDGSPNPVLAREMRYPGGDCTSDIFISICPFTPKKKDVNNVE